MKKGMVKTLTDSFLQETRFAVIKKALTQKETIDVATVKKLNILTGGADINVLIHDNPNIYVVLDTYEDGPELTVNDHGDSIDIIARMERDHTFISFKLPPVRLQITVPCDIANTWNINAGSGRLSAAGIKTDSFYVGLGSGNLDLRAMKAKKAMLKTSSGSMVTRDLEVDDLYFQTSSGKAELAGIDSNNITGSTSSGGMTIMNIHAGEFAAKASSGNISASNIVANEMEFRITSGNIVVDSLHVKKATLKASSGKIAISAIKDCAIDASASSGKITIASKNKELNATVQVSTSSGRITHNLPMNIHNQSSNRLEGTIGNGKNLMQLKTNSGAVHIS